MEGESLSSWRQRLAWVNGYRLFPVLDERTRRTDPDIKISVREARWLADLSTLSTDEIASMTIEEPTHEPVRVTRSRHPLWVIPSRTYKAPRWGSMLCPDCLAEGDEPYFRLQWRMAYNLSCARHHRWLIDQCPGCGHAPWPTGSSVRMALSPAYTSHAFCWACGFDLRQFAGQNDRDLCGLIGDIPEQMRGLLMDRIDPDTSVQDLLQGLHALSQLNVRTRHLFSEQHRNSIEMYSLETRKEVIGQAFACLQDWPNLFIRDVKAKGLTRSSFNGQYSSLPPWIKVVVDGDLAQQNRSVSKEVAEHTFLGLRTALGRNPRQADMRRVLGEAGDSYVRALVEKRTVLSAVEIWLMQQRAFELQSAAQKRSDTLRAFKKGALCLSISAGSGMTLKEVAELSAAELLEHVHCIPTSLKGWVWGGVVVEVDQVSTLVVGTARHLLKLSRGYMRSLMEPLADDVLRSEVVVRNALGRSDV
ncbi:MAG: TniQ family protein [Thiobacillus sp.]|nr:TniQ family protein [Thiobacillus sp.]